MTTDKTIYKGYYLDSRGKEAISLHNDGSNLEVEIRGVRFVGPDFDGLCPLEGTPAGLLESFRLCRGELCSCQLVLEIPVSALVREQPAAGLMTMSLTLGDPRETGGIDSEILSLELLVGEETFRSKGTSGWFEDELLSLQASLPATLTLRSCFHCLFSDYSPYGHGLFGGLICFRNIPEQYLAVKQKEDLLAILNRSQEQVQETSLCEQFQPRVPGTGYRG